ncbi:VOC family protein [Dactylosporangium sp. NPDC051485]|uniref:VOC family protein n=1 Tax=Dactylosporangium sp. NPDC051485 TaxID=3154846 RepID=UPI00342CABFD
MTVTLNHTIVPALDNAEAAGFLAGIMGFELLPPSGRTGHFRPVRVNETLTLDFMTVLDPEGHHLAFAVDGETFDDIHARITDRGVPFGNGPTTPDNGRIDHPLCPRGLFFRDATGNLYEVMSAQ